MSPAERPGGTADAGATPAGPVRTCLGCRARDSQGALVRLAWDGHRLLVSRTAAGRGAWVHPRPDCLRAASHKGVLARAFRTAVPAGALAGSALGHLLAGGDVTQDGQEGVR